MHPFAPESQTAGYRELLESLERYLISCTGFDACSLQPTSGAAGEYAGLLVIRKYFESIGQSDRNICIIPRSAHGTNPASAAMCDMEIKWIDDSRGPRRGPHHSASARARERVGAKKSERELWRARAWGVERGYAHGLSSARPPGNTKADLPRRFLRRSAWASRLRSEGRVDAGVARRISPHARMLRRAVQNTSRYFTEVSGAVVHTSRYETLSSRPCLQGVPKTMFHIAQAGLGCATSRVLMPSGRQPLGNGAGMPSAAPRENACGCADACLETVSPAGLTASLESRNTRTSLGCAALSSCGLWRMLCPVAPMVAPLVQRGCIFLERCLTCLVELFATPSRGATSLCVAHRHTDFV